MRTSLVRVVAILALSSVFVMAQHRTPPDPAEMMQHHIDHLTKMLSLTPAQQQQATTIFNEAANNATTVHDQLRTAHQALQTAIQKNDTATIEQTSNTIGSLTAQMTAAHAKAEAALFQTLTPEQQTKFTQMQSHHGPGMHEHGGPGGPPPGASFR